MSGRRPNSIDPLKTSDLNQGWVGVVLRLEERIEIRHIVVVQDSARLCRKLLKPVRIYRGFASGIQRFRCIRIDTRRCKQTAPEVKLVQRVWSIPPAYARFSGYIGAWGKRPVRPRKGRVAFEEELENPGNSVKAVQICEENFSIMIDASEMERLLAKHPKVDEVFFANDELAIGALLHCQSNGFSVPQDVAIADFNGVETARMMSSRLTRLSTPRFEQGRIAGTPVELQSKYELPVELFTGETS